MKNFTVKVVYKNFKEGIEHFEVCGLCRLTYILDGRKDIRMYEIVEEK